MMGSGELTNGPLLGPDYVDPGRFAWESSRLFPGQPMLAEISARLLPGEFSRCAIATESMIIARDADGHAHAFANACLHRGFPLLEESDICRAALVCPYHGWRYAANGALVSARGLEQPSQAVRPTLRKLACREGGGIILAAQRPIASETVDKAVALFKMLGVDRATPIADERFIVKCNWKIWVENFLECWHCTINHPELSITEGHVRQFERDDYAGFSFDRQNLVKQAERFDLALPPSCELDPSDTIFAFWEVVPLGGNRHSPTPDGGRLGPALASEGLDGGFVFGAIGPFLHFSVAVDHAVLFSFLPHRADETVVHTRWLGLPDTDAEAVSWLWRNTLAQDQALTERQQRGVNSRFYRGGSYLPHEQRTNRFTAWWRRLVALDTLN